MRRALLAAVVFMTFASSAAAATTIGGAPGGGIKPKTVYLGNDGLKNIHWLVWTSNTAVGTGTDEPGGASCSQNCTHTVLTVFYSLPAMAACGKHGARVLTFTYAQLSSGVYYRLGQPAPGTCTWYVRGENKPGVLP